MAKNMVQYLHFRILKFPLIILDVVQPEALPWTTSANTFLGRAVLTTGGQFGESVQRFHRIFTQETEGELNGIMMGLSWDISGYNYNNGIIIIINGIMMGLLIIIIIIVITIYFLIWMGEYL